MKKFLLPTIAIAALSGCATVPKVAMNAGTTSAMQAKTVAHTTRPMPFIGTLKASGVAFGLIGAAMHHNDAKNLLASQNITDPADDIAREVMQVL